MLLLGAVRAEEVVVGVNVVNPMRASVADQNAVLSQLEAAHVHVIRCGITNDDTGIDYAKRAAAKGIRILLGVGAEYPPNAQKRPYQPDKFPAMWSGHPLSYADPELSCVATERRSHSVFPEARFWTVSELPITHFLEPDFWSGIISRQPAIRE